MMDIQLKEVIEYLQKKGYECIPIDKRDGKFVDIDILTTICGKDIRLRCKFPKTFPYDFPQVYILEEFYKDIAPIPHINKDFSICTFDKNIAIPNHREPLKLVEETISQAIKIIEDGIKGVNKEDFIEEFNSYWGNETLSEVEVWVLSTLDNYSQLLYFYYDEKNFYVSNDKFQLEEYLHYIKGLSINKENIKRCLYIPMKNRWYPPYPKTNKEVFLKVREEKEAFEAYCKFLKNRTEASLIIFSQQINGERYFGAWLHKPVKSPKSFRKGKVLPELAYLIQYKDEEIMKLTVQLLDRRRLFNRGGDGTVLSNCTVSITGCGSIGSYLIQALAELGICKFTLIDNQLLTSENIARHICGTSDIYKWKTEAIKEQLIKHYPYIKCKSIPRDVLEVLEDSLDIFNQCDINFIVVGSKSVEIKFLELFNQGKITKPLVIIWVEPFLLGGHAIIVQNKQDIESLIYDEKYRFKYSILVDGEKYTKKEAGCQSTYIPYSAFEARQFVYNFMDYFYNNHMINETKGNYLFSWCGNLKWARKENMMISDAWLSKSKRTVSIKRLDLDDQV